MEAGQREGERGFIQRLVSWGGIRSMDRALRPVHPSLGAGRGLTALGHSVGQRQVELLEGGAEEQFSLLR